MSPKHPKPTGTPNPWDRALHFADDPSPTAARALLKLAFSSTDQARMAELLAKARAGTLSAAEEDEAETFERLGCVLDILHSTARRVLDARRTAS